MARNISAARTFSFIVAWLIQTRQTILLYFNVDIMKIRMETSISYLLLFSSRMTLIMTHLELFYYKSYTFFLISLGFLIMTKASKMNILMSLISPIIINVHPIL